MRRYRNTLLAAVASLSLSACASLAPEAPENVAEFSTANDTVKPWATPPAPQPVSRLAAAVPRATSFAGIPKLREPFFSNEQLHRNFLSIALRAEAADGANANGDIALAKWQMPLRYQLVGATPADAARVAALVMQIKALTGIDIAPAAAYAPNVRLSFVPFRVRDTVVAQLYNTGGLGPEVGSMVTSWRDAEKEKCLGLISVDPISGAISKADILIKDELPPRIRNACIVEEVVQSLGLMNDDPSARPSIFNDSQEYLDLTSHDEFLLRILYDPRVRPGMSAGQISPLISQIIQELRPTPSPLRVKS